LEFSLKDSSKAKGVRRISVLETQEIFPFFSERVELQEWKMLIVAVWQDRKLDKEQEGDKTRLSTARKVKPNPSATIEGLENATEITEYRVGKNPGLRSILCLTIIYIPRLRTSYQNPFPRPPHSLHRPLSTLPLNLRRSIHMSLQNTDELMPKYRGGKVVSN
jgi:hypothetical protein